MWSFLAISVTWKGPLVTSVSGAVAHLSPLLVSTSLRMGAPAGSAASHMNAGSGRDRKSTRLNSSHLVISYAVFCLKKKKTISANRLALHAVVFYLCSVFTVDDRIELCRNKDVDV